MNQGESIMLLPRGPAVEGRSTRPNNNKNNNKKEGGGRRAAKLEKNTNSDISHNAFVSTYSIKIRQHSTMRYRRFFMTQCTVEQSISKFCIFHVFVFVDAILGQEPAYVNPATQDITATVLALCTLSGEIADRFVPRAQCESKRDGFGHDLSREVLVSNNKYVPSMLLFKFYCQVCSCQNDAYCDPASGKCTCSPGFRGTL